MTDSRKCHKCRGTGEPSPQATTPSLFCDWCDGKGFLSDDDYARLVPAPLKMCAVGVNGKKKVVFYRSDRSARKAYQKRVEN